MPESTDELRQKWDQRHRSAEDLGEAAVVLRENTHLLPPAGDALDLACGRGINAIRLAQQGLHVSAWDLSPVAIERLSSAAHELGLSIAAEVRDVVACPPQPESFDIILVSYFLERSLVPYMIGALRPGGLIFYQTFSVNAVSTSGPSNPDFRLQDNELLELFRPLKIRYYREEGTLGNTGMGVRDIAMLVAEKSS